MSKMRLGGWKLGQLTLTMLGLVACLPGKQRSKCVPGWGRAFWKLHRRTFIHDAGCWGLAGGTVQNVLRDGVAHFGAFLGDSWQAVSKIAHEAGWVLGPSWGFLTSSVQNALRGGALWRQDPLTFMMLGLGANAHICAFLRQHQEK